MLALKPCLCDAANFFVVSNFRQWEFHSTASTVQCIFIVWQSSVWKALNELGVHLTTKFVNLRLTYNNILGYSHWTNYTWLLLQPRFMRRMPVSEHYFAEKCVPSSHGLTQSSTTILDRESQVLTLRLTVNHRQVCHNITSIVKLLVH